MFGTKFDPYSYFCSGYIASESVFTVVKFVVAMETIKCEP